MLNERNEKTKKVIHIMVTSLCNRNCPHCCNKQYDLNDIPYVTDEELKEAEVICITGGEPFLYSNPDKIARHYKQAYPNIKKIYVYTNALELYDYMCDRSYTNPFKYIDGLNVSIKTSSDLLYFSQIYAYDLGYIFDNMDNRLYYFDDDLKPAEHDNFQFIKRDWQEEFVPADDSIFRKV